MSGSQSLAVKQRRSSCQCSCINETERPRLQPVFAETPVVPLTILTACLRLPPLMSHFKNTFLALSSVHVNGPVMQPLPRVDA